MYGGDATRLSNRAHRSPRYPASMMPTELARRSGVLYMLERG